MAHNQTPRIGTNDDIRNIVGSDTEVIDATGLTVTPGFIDAHSYPASGGVREIVSVNLDLRSRDAIKKAIAARAAKTAPGEWVLGFASGRAMAMSTPYVGRPDDHGILRMTQEEIYEAVEDAHRHDFQVGLHANGDLANDMVLKAYERVLEKWPRPDARHRIEHCSLVNPDLLRRIKATGSIPTPSTPTCTTTAASGKCTARKR